MGNRSATVHQKLIRIADKKLIADADVTFAVIDNTTGKSVALNDEMRKMLS